MPSSFSPKVIILSFFAFASTHQTANAQIDTVRVYFEINQSDMMDATPIEGKLSELAQSNGIMIIGYASGPGSTSSNQALSEARAASVANYLKMQGIGRSKLAEVAGKGELPGLESQENRRVDIIFESQQPDIKSPVVASAPEENVVVEIEPQAKPEVMLIDSTVKENIVLEGLSFIGGRHFPTPESMPVLYDLVETMKRYPQLEIEIQGHICCEYTQFDGIDDDTMQPELSKNRAKYVYKFLIQNGIPASRMSFVGKGSSEPKVFPEKTPEDEQMNRRVEIKITRYP